MSILSRLPFPKQFGHPRDEILVIDLSKRTTKAVHLRRDGNGFALVSYCLQKAPSEATAAQGDIELLAAHLQSVRRALGAKTRDTVLVISMEDSMLRNVEVGPMEKAELRQMLTLNSRHFFQQDMPGFVFDCFLPALNGHDNGPHPKAGKQTSVLVGTAKRELVGRLESAAKEAGLNPVQITCAQMGLANAALQAKRDLPHQGTLLLLEIGVNTSTVSFLADGTLALTRGIGIGINQLGRGLASAYKINYPVADEFKASMIQNNLQNVLAPLAHEVRGAIEYFSDLQGRQVSDGYLTSDLAGSSLVVETLQVLEIPCRRLNFKGVLTVDLPREREAQLQNALAQLEIALGAGAGWFQSERIEINFLVEQIEASAARWRDPLRWAIGVGAFLVFSLVLWAASIQWRSFRTGAAVRMAQADLKSLEKAGSDAVAASRRAGQTDRDLSALEAHATNRFLWALPLNALQLATVDQIQVVGLKIEQNLIHADAVRATPTARAKPAQTKEQILLTITAKNFADTEAEEKFIERIASVPYFKGSLRKKDPVLLKNRLPRQADPLDPAKTFTLFTLECRYPERVLGHD